MTRRWVRHFSEGSAAERDLLGGKGANLAEMTRLGLPVPPGFTITTDAFRALRSNKGVVPETLWEETAAALADVESQLNRTFGDPSGPLLLSVRSGARDSMPGMMDTILNVGLNDATVEGLAALSGDRFAWDSYRRLVQMYGRVVLEVDGDLFEEILSEARRESGVEHDHELDAEQLKRITRQFQTTISEHGATFPGEPWDQLRGAVLAVFRSWDSPRAVAYRRSHNFPDDGGTAVNIQAMVFGNIGPACASGVAFTRNPNSGAAGLFGEFMINAQGEDVVSGVRTPLSTDEMVDNPLFAQAHADLLEVSRKLEHHFTDMQDLEFTVEHSRLWMLQTRTGKRTAAAAVRIAVEMAHEGLINRETAVRRVRPEHIESLLHPQIDQSREFTVLAKGMPASPGAASGKAVFTPEKAKELGEAGEAVILVRNETAAEDFPGMERSRGILTARGGMTSHAAVVARGMGLPAVTGCSAIEVDARHSRFWAGDEVIFEGDIITIDGTSGQVIRGEAAMTKPGLNDEARTLLSWADAVRKLGVRTNADTPADAARAVDFGAEGIGLCRTEHMFFAPGRIEAMRRMILAQSDAERTRALGDLQVFQTADFAGIFRAMAGRPVTIRLLDPPLHEFLPTTDDELHELAVDMGIDRAAIVQIVESMREVNPMLGLRGVRLGMTFPDVTRMQARAIFAAALTVSSESNPVHPEIMIPLVSAPNELIEQRRLIDEVANDVFSRAGRRIEYKIGTMIEVPRAALIAGSIAEHADFFSLGTNDLTQMTFGLSRDDSARFLPGYIERGILGEDPFQTLDQDGVGQLVEIATRRGREAKPGLSVGVCGEHGGDPASIHFCHRAGLDYVSCSPFRVPVARLAAAHAELTIPRD